MSKNKQVAFLTFESTEEFFIYDQLLDEPLNRRGWTVSHIPWRRKSVDWNLFDVVVVRSTWDYQDDVEEFVNTLETINCSNAVLENPLSLMQWNIQKTYLKQLQQAGVPIVPTIWRNGFVPDDLTTAYAQFETDALIIKPVVSANADDTFKLTGTQSARTMADLAHCFRNRDCMLQPFLPSVLEPGEISLFYFCGHYSHGILKTPCKGDFRVQEEHGGQLSVVTPTQSMLDLGKKTLNALPTNRAPLYARIDMIEANTGYVIMEVELIEPSLYFNMDEASIQRFCDAFCERYDKVH